MDNRVKFYSWLIGLLDSAHLTCVNSTKSDIDANLDDFVQCGIENILALRGDYVSGVEPKKEFVYASDLCSYIKKKGDFDIAGACYPEVHIEAKDEVEDVLNLKNKEIAYLGETPFFTGVQTLCLDKRMFAENQEELATVNNF